MGGLCSSDSLMPPFLQHLSFSSSHTSTPQPWAQRARCGSLCCARLRLLLRQAWQSAQRVPGAAVGRLPVHRPSCAAERRCRTRPPPPAPVAQCWCRPRRPAAARPEAAPGQWAQPAAERARPPAQPWWHWLRRRRARHPRAAATGTAGAALAAGRARAARAATGAAVALEAERPRVARVSLPVRAALLRKCLSAIAHKNHPGVKIKGQTHAWSTPKNGRARKSTIRLGTFCGVVRRASASATATSCNRKTLQTLRRPYQLVRLTLPSW